MLLLSSQLVTLVCAGHMLSVTLLCCRLNIDCCDGYRWLHLPLTLEPLWLFWQACDGLLGYYLVAAHLQLLIFFLPSFYPS